MSRTCTSMRPPTGRLSTLLAILLFLSMPFVTALLIDHVGAQDSGDMRAGRPLAPTSGVWLVAVVTDPQTDRGGTEAITSTDEAVVLWNAGSATVDLDGWSLVMADGTDETQVLDGTIGAGAARVFVNPDGTLNNDVTLRLIDTGGTVADQLTLGADGVPDGNAVDSADEVVHLAGAWAATRGPWTTQWPLAAYWVDSVARQGTTNMPMAPAWHAGEPVAWDLTLHAAPGRDAQAAFTNASLVYEDGVSVAVNDTTMLDDDVWRVTTDALTPPAADTATFALEPTDEEALTHFLDGTPFTVLRDATAPVVADDTVVATSDGRIHWFPPARDPDSGITDTVVWFTNGTGEDETVTPGDACLPLEAPSEACAVDDPANTTAWLVVENGAGTIENVSRAIVVDDTAPTVPGIGFETQVPPRLVWDPADEPLSRVVVELADDVTGVWGRADESVDPDATTFVDEAWIPGEPRAYRLNITDRAGHEAVGPWVALPPEKVPVQAVPALDDDTAGILVKDGAVGIAVGFDRTMAEAPRLVLEGHNRDPFWLEADGTLDAEARTASYTLTTDTALPASGRATWRLVGGHGGDDAPVEDPARPTSWDAAAPEVHVDGASDVWVAASRHVVTITATDTADDRPRIDFDPLPDGVRASGRIDDRRLTLRGEGRFEVQGHAADPAGNRASFVVRLGLDATPPTVVRDDTETTGRWNASSPVRLTVSDETSDVNRSSLQVWVRNGTTAVEAVLSGWSDGTATLVPSSAVPDGLVRPVTVYAAVADRAGNLAEGRVGDGLPGHGIGTRTDGGAATRAYGLQGDGTETSAPASAGPSWDLLQRPEDGDDTASGDSDGAAGDASDWGGARRGRDTAPATNAASADGDPAMSVWALAGLLGSVGLGTVVVRRRKNATTKRAMTPQAEEEGKRQKEAGRV